MNVAKKATPMSVPDNRIHVGLVSMTYKKSSKVSDEKAFSIQVLGETGGTVVYVFPSGDARVKKGKKANINAVSRSVKPKTVVSNQASSTDPLHKIQPEGIKAPPPPPPHHGSSVNPIPIHGQKSTLNQPAQKIRSTNYLSNEESLKTKPLKQSLREYLLSNAFVTRTQIDVAHYDMTTSGMSFEDVLLARGWITAKTITDFHAL